MHHYCVIFTPFVCFVVGPMRGRKWTWHGRGGHRGFGAKCTTNMRLLPLAVKHCWSVLAADQPSSVSCELLAWVTEGKSARCAEIDSPSHASVYCFGAPHIAWCIKSRGVKLNNRSEECLIGCCACLVGAGRMREWCITQPRLGSLQHSTSSESLVRVQDLSRPLAKAADSVPSVPLYDSESHVILHHTHLV